jgi:hypothetical protein
MKTAKKVAAVLAAIAILGAPTHLLLLLFPTTFHFHTLRLLVAYAGSLVVTVPILMKAHQYFHEG